MKERIIKIQYQREDDPCSTPDGMVAALINVLSSNLSPGDTWTTIIPRDYLFDGTTIPGRMIFTPLSEVIDYGKIAYDFGKFWKSVNNKEVGSK